MKALKLNFHTGEEPGWWRRLRDNHMRIAIFYSSCSGRDLAYHHDFLHQWGSSVKCHTDLRTDDQGDKDTVVLSSVQVKR